MHISSALRTEHIQISSAKHFFRSQSLRQYLNRLDPSQDHICPSCSLEVQDLLHSVCECPATMTIRQSVWEPPRVLRVACHSICGCGGVRKEDLGQPSRLT